jgi:hypothetical protein
MPGRQQSRRQSRQVKKKSGNSFKLVLKILIPLALLVAGFLFFKINTRHWNGSDKLSFVYPSNSGDVIVTVLDPKLSEKSSFIVPADTQVNVAGGYGTLRIKNVWQLGLNEKLNGNLLSRTVTQNFNFPTTLWSETGINETKKFIFSPGKTNIKIGDRIMMAIFSMKVKGIDETEINLADNLYVKKQNLADGLPGYVLLGPVSNRLTVFFADNELSEKNVKYNLMDATSKPGLTDKVGEILEVLGGKVVSVERLPLEENTDCLVYGKMEIAVEKVASLFSCQKTDTVSEYDVEMKVGGKFSKRF